MDGSRAGEEIDAGLVSTLSAATFFARAGLFVFATVDLPPAFGLVTLPDETAAVLLFFATTKIPPLTTI